MKKKVLIIVFLLLFLICNVTIFLYSSYKKEQKIEYQKKLKIEIENHYDSVVITNKETKLYDKDNKIVGKISDNIVLNLEKIKIDHNSNYFLISNFGKKYYIEYKDVEAYKEKEMVDERYKNYILFNENIITKDITNFYDENDKLLYSLNESFNLPIIIKDNNKYGVQFNNRLLYIKNSDISEIKENKNTDKKNSSGVAVLNYHAFYDENNEEERKNCNSDICHSISQFKEHLNFFSENNIFTLKMDEYEKYIDGKIQLPKSVLITIDDGGRTKHAIDLLTEYKMYATIFLVTSWFDLNDYYYTEYIEFHSHTHDMHNVGICPGGQGGGIKCLPEETVLNDLKMSREKLKGTTALCYPFYEYNNYSIELAKKAGFTLGFAGETYYNDNLTHVGTNKFKLNRFVITVYTSMADITTYFDQIKS